MDWKYGGRRNLDPKAMRAHTVHVVVVDHPGGPWEAIHCRTQEQAELCAAAPELLAACKELLAKLARERYRVFATKPELAAIARAEAVIAKAEGKEGEHDAS